MTENIIIIPNRNCEKCGNPKQMYYCNHCESSTENEICETCELKANKDDHYHDNCTNMEKLIIELSTGDIVEIEQDKKLVLEATTEDGTMVELTINYKE